MAEDTKPQAEEKKELQIIPLPDECLGHKIVRNDVEKPLVPFARLKGKRAGNCYLGLNTSIETMQEDIKFLGDNNVANILRTAVKKMCQDVWNGCINEAGEFNLAQFLTEIKDLTSSGMLLSEIEEKLEELNDTLMKALAHPENFAKPEFAAQMGKLTEEVNAYKAMAEKRSKKGKKDEASVPAVVA